MENTEHNIFSGKNKIKQSDSIKTDAKYKKMYGHFHTLVMGVEGEKLFLRGKMFWPKRLTGMAVYQTERHSTLKGTLVHWSTLIKGIFFPEVSPLILIWITAELHVTRF